jgi:hypothetical protein
MWFLTLVSWIAIVIQLVFIVLSVAAGLYYLAELVEEYTKVTAQVIRYLILFCLFINGLYLIFEEFPLLMVLFGILSQVVHLVILQSFPYIELSSVPFISGLLLLIVNHYYAFSYFASNYFPFSQVLGYFTISLWLIPFAFFISLSANDNVLPTTIAGSYSDESSTLINSDSADIVSHYISFGRKKKIGLLSFLNNAKESLLPQRIKRNI